MIDLNLDDGLAGTAKDSNVGCRFPPPPLPLVAQVGVTACVLNAQSSNGTKLSLRGDGACL